MTETCIFCDGPVEDNELYCDKQQCQEVKESRQREIDFERRDLDFPFGEDTLPVQSLYPYVDQSPVAECSHRAAECPPRSGEPHHFLLPVSGRR